MELRELTPQEQALQELSFEQLLLLHENCIQPREKTVSDECFRRYGIELEESDESPSKNFLWFLLGGVLGAIIIVIQNMFF